MNLISFVCRTNAIDGIHWIFFLTTQQKQPKSLVVGHSTYIASKNPAKEQILVAELDLLRPKIKICICANCVNTIKLLHHKRFSFRKKMVIRILFSLISIFGCHVSKIATLLSIQFRSPFNQLLNWCRDSVFSLISCIIIIMVIDRKKENNASKQ